MFRTPLSVPRPILPHWVRLALPIISFLIFGSLLINYAHTLNISSVWKAIERVSWQAWSAALAATGLSFWAVGHYDALLHRVIGTGVSTRRARASGRCAIAIGQLLGIGVMTGTIIRWKFLPGFSVVKAAHLSLLVSLSFLAAWAVLTGIAVSMAGNGLSLHPALRIGAGLAIAGVATGLAFQTLLPPRWQTSATTGTFVALLFWAALDTGFAALAFYVFIPHGLSIGPVHFVAIYLLALGAGLLSNSPAGLGAFELTVLACLPAVRAENLIGALICYRLVYYALPALIAVVALAAPRKQLGPSALMARRKGDLTDLRTKGAPAGWGLTRQGANLTTSAMSGWMYRDIAGLRVAVGPVLGQADVRDFEKFSDKASRDPVLYKCDPRTACDAQRNGWTVKLISKEAIICTETWSLETPRRRQLRRKLRHAEKAGIRVIRAAAPLPTAALTQVATAWEQEHSQERGFSMGQFEPGYLGHQAVFMAVQGSQLLGFVSFHKGVHDWSLDLMRHQGTVPDGAMHAMVVAGIEAAKAEGVASVSLAAVPEFGPKWANRLLTRSARGLIQFKSSFAPEWKPRYLAAPNSATLARSAIMIWWQVHHPKSPTPVETLVKSCDATGQLDKPCVTASALTHSHKGRNHDQCAVPSP